MIDTKQVAKSYFENRMNLTLDDFEKVFEYIYDEGRDGVVKDYSGNENHGMRTHRPNWGHIKNISDYSFLDDHSFVDGARFFYISLGFQEGIHIYCHGYPENDFELYKPIFNDTFKT